MFDGLILGEVKLENVWLLLRGMTVGKKGLE